MAKISTEEKAFQDLDTAIRSKFDKKFPTISSFDFKLRSKGYLNDKGVFLPERRIDFLRDMKCITKYVDQFGVTEWMVVEDSIPYHKEWTRLMSQRDSWKASMEKADREKLKQWEEMGKETVIHTLPTLDS